MSRAVMQQALEALENAGEAVYAHGGIAAVGSLNTAAQALRATIAEPEQIGYARCPRCWEPITAPIPRKPLSDEEVRKHLAIAKSHEQTWLMFARAIERAHGIGEQT